jgi:hypothetical protein
VKVPPLRRGFYKGFLMAFTFLKADSVILRTLADEERMTGYDVWLLPDGESAPGGLIQLTENGQHDGMYEFGGSITNGRYQLYIGTAGAQLPVQIDGEDVYISVVRSGTVQVENTDFGEPW